ncbi:MAG: AzlC family ABC transporter permease [Candidatus Faecousia sp.]|nr:AzlC family ABC transporter permease [Candidatus Faecousia sp.]
MDSKLFRTAFRDTIPVMTGYLFLGFGFGILAQQNGLSLWWALAMSAFIYAGSMQFVAVTMLSGGTNIFAAALTTLAVNARHLFYGLSMIDRYKSTGKKKPYLIFSLTDETYSLVSQKEPGQDGGNYYFLVSALDQFYWCFGTLLGAAAGQWIFGEKGEAPAVISYLGRVLPYAVMAMLVVYCLKGLDFSTPGKYLPELLCTILVAGLHAWKRNTLLSIGVGTVAYMLLVQLVF